ncbi:MAG TPA: hypothetical protein PK228_10760 [Saprospiraceae bacterium]|nr:hypothetical protein [Saprospiraceae bacterium]
MRIGYWLLLSLFILCHTLSAQGYQQLYQYFEADSTERRGYSSIREQTTQTTITKKNSLREIKTVETFYDESGRLIREERSGNAGIESQLTFGYDSVNGRLNYILQFSGKIKYEAFAQYDEQGRLSEVVHCPEDKPCQIRHYAYDEDNTERLYIPRQTIEMQFNKNKPGTLFGFSALNKDKDELVRERFFDPEGKPEEIRQYSGGHFSVAWTYEYDPSGRKTKVWINNDKEKMLAAEYVYDNPTGLLQSEKIYVWVVGTQILPYRDQGPETTFLTYDSKNRLIKTESDNKNAGKTREYTYFEY